MYLYIIIITIPYFRFNPEMIFFWVYRVTLKLYYLAGAGFRGPIIHGLGSNLDCRWEGYNCVFGYVNGYQFWIMINSLLWKIVVGSELWIDFILNKMLTIIIAENFTIEQWYMQLHIIYTYIMYTVAIKTYSLFY